VITYSGKVLLLNEMSIDPLEDVFAFKQSVKMIPTGAVAPDFELAATNQEKKFRLSAMRGKRVIIAFYPADWSPVCTDQLSFYNEVVEIFTQKNAILIGISVDSKWCHLAFSKDRKLEFPLLADFEPKGAIAEKYGVYNKVNGEAERALYLVDENGMITWSYLSPINVNPGVDGILKALDNGNN
jgi:peroxiredoxin